jgi:hypothetical protein
MTATSSLREELNGAEKGGPEHDAQVFGEVTDLFLSSFDRLSESQIAAVDAVLAKLVDRVVATSLVELSEELAVIEQAPRQTVRNLAFHADATVAGPASRTRTCSKSPAAAASSICSRSATARRSTRR